MLLEEDDDDEVEASDLFPFSCLHSSIVERLSRIAGDGAALYTNGAIAFGLGVSSGAAVVSGVKGPVIPCGPSIMLSRKSNPSGKVISTARDSVSSATGATSLGPTVYGF